MQLEKPFDFGLHMFCISIRSWFPPASSSLRCGESFTHASEPAACHRLPGRLRIAVPAAPRENRGARARKGSACTPLQRRLRFGYALMDLGTGCIIFASADADSDFLSHKLEFFGYSCRSQARAVRTVRSAGNQIQRRASAGLCSALALTRWLFR